MKRGVVPTKWVFGQGNLVLQHGQSTGELQVMLETVGSRSTGLGAGITAGSSLHHSPGSLLWLCSVAKYWTRLSALGECPSAHGDCWNYLKPADKQLRVRPAGDFAVAGCLGWVLSFHTGLVKESSFLNVYFFFNLLGYWCPQACFTSNIVLSLVSSVIGSLLCLVGWLLNRSKSAGELHNQSN